MNPNVSNQPIAPRASTRLTHADLLQLKRWNTPTIYNGWEQITRADPARDGFNLEETHDFMPQMGPMIGFAVTVVIQPGAGKHRLEQPRAWSDYRRYVAEAPGPKIVVVQDLDKPHTFGSFWGEVNINVHQALGCIGTITDGAVRSLNTLREHSFKSIARRACVGRGHVWPVQWGCEVNVFGTTISPDQLIHADEHGFLALPPEDEHALLEATKFIDALESRTVIAEANNVPARDLTGIGERLEEAFELFERAVARKFGK
jgi:regulator of RNase E activity RraA